MNISPSDRMLEAYFCLMNVNAQSHIYHVAKQVGLLAAMQERSSPVSADELAQQCDLAQLPTTLTLHALAAMELVFVDAPDRFSLTPLARLLLAGSYQNLSDEYWNCLPQFLRTGRPMTQMDDSSQSESHYVKQANAMAWMCAPAAAQLAQVLQIGAARRGISILDIGAGSGVWSLTLASHDPAVRVTAVDWPGVLEIAAAVAQHQGLGDRLTLLAGNFNEIELPADTFDLAIVANVTHLLTPAANAALFSRVRRSLRESGEMAIIDVLNQQLQGALARSVYALGLALRTAAGQVHSRDSLSQLLIESGYEVPQHHDLSAPPGVFGVLIARRR